MWPGMVLTSKRGLLVGASGNNCLVGDRAGERPGARGGVGDRAAERPGAGGGVGDRAAERPGDLTERTADLTVPFSKRMGDLAFLFLLGVER